MFHCSRHRDDLRVAVASLVSRDIVLMRTNVIHLLNRVPEHDSLTFFRLSELPYRTKCKPMHFEWERFFDVTLTLILNPNPKR